MNITTELITEEKKITEFLKCSLSNIKPYNEDLGIVYHLRTLCIDLNFHAYNRELIQEDDYREFNKTQEYAINALKSELVSNYQITSIINITSILCEAKLLHDIGLLSNDEFVSIFISVRLKIFQKFSSIKNNYLKSFGITKNSLSKLRAKLATLQNEN